MDCPICFECIETAKNCVTTECGHCFHANCLMKSVAHNGFGCPYCRTAMAEVVKEEEYEDDDEYDEEDDEEEDEEYVEDYLLRGMRWLIQRAQGEEPDTFESDEPVSITSNQITQKIVEQGVTMEQLIGILFNDKRVFSTIKYSRSRSSRQIFEKIQSIIDDYNDYNIYNEEEGEGNEEDDDYYRSISEKRANDMRLEAESALRVELANRDALRMVYEVHYDDNYYRSMSEESCDI